MGPWHPSMHGVHQTRVILDDGDGDVIDCEFNIGLCKGWRKLLKIKQSSNICLI